jgi:phage gpG-like protein
MVGRVTFDEGDKARRMKRALENPSVALKQIGILMVAESQSAFSAQRLDKKVWRERAPVNVFGILADMEAGRPPPARRFEQRPALRDTGRLSSSIAFQVRSPVVEVGTDLPYASVHQFGGETTSSAITPQIRRRLWEWLKDQSRTLRRQLGWLLNNKFKGQTLTAKVPARPFVGITGKTEKTVRRVIGVEIMEAK